MIRTTAPLAIALLFASASAWSQATVEPAEPAPLEPVHLRQTVDDCAFNAERVTLRFEDSVIRVNEPLNECFAPGEPVVVDIELGAYPVGEYRVEVTHYIDEPPIARIDFSVEPADASTTTPHPLADHGGIWWTAADPGWGISLSQGRNGDLFGAIFVFDAGGQPTWYTLGGGHWLSSTQWTGDLIRTTRPGAAKAQNAVVGSISFDFTTPPGKEGQASLTYRIDSTDTARTITRLRL